jgi:uncharacterized membrane protein
MNKNRLEAFSDGVIAILITIMVFDLKPPVGSDWGAFSSLLPLFFTYVLSFLYLGVYWNNHHHLLQAARRINGTVLWANLHLLFWLSLLPFATNWLRSSDFAALPTAIYGGVLLLAALAYTWLQFLLIRVDQADAPLRSAVGRNWKGKFSICCYAAGIAAAFHDSTIALGLYSLVALLWLIPDRRIESLLTLHQH